jgi:hypothetical protein
MVVRTHRSDIRLRSVRVKYYDIPERLRAPAGDYYMLRTVGIRELVGTYRRPGATVVLYVISTA